MSKEKTKLETFLEPENIVQIGASRKTGPTSFNIFENILKSDFPGEVYPVNPKADEILGKKCYSRVKEIEKEIDLAVISTPREPVIDIVQDCAEKNINSIIIIGQGFSDAGEKGQALEKELENIVAETNVNILGPNTLGVQNIQNRLSTAFFPVEEEKWKTMEKWKTVGLVSQTGFFLRGIPGFYFGKAIDIGNACDIDHVDALRYFKNDSDIEQIFLHIEGLERGKEFMTLAKETTEEKPVLTLKTGRSEKGADMAASHTGSMTGEEKVYGGVFKQTGITRVNNLRELQIYTKGLMNLPKMKGDNVAVITTTGAAGIIAADAIEKHGLKMADLSKQTIEKIEDLSPEWLDVKNPIDIWPAMMVGKGGIGESYGIALVQLLEDESVDGIVSIAPLGESPGDNVDVLGETVESLNGLLKKYEKPVVSWLIHEKADTERGRELMKVENLAVFDTINEAVKTLSLIRKESNGGNDK